MYLYKNWKLIEKVDWKVWDIKSCSLALLKYWIYSDKPWIDLMTKAREQWYNIMNY